MSDGARLSKSCEVLEISVRTYQRWKSGNISDKRKGAAKKIPAKPGDFEKQEIIDTCCSDESKDSNPYDIFITLRNPCGWSNPVNQWKENHTVYLNPSLETIAKTEEAA